MHSNLPISWRNLLASLLLGLAATGGHAQWIDPENGIVVEPSASVSQFMRYGNTPVSLYTGSADVSVPIYTYSDHDLTLPISLKYVFTGQKPNDPAGSVGLGWMLNAGGYVTRQVNNLPDEAMMRGNNSVYGFYYMYSNGWSVPTIDTSNYTYQNTSFYYYPMGALNVEAEPDIFSFNFLGHSGKFMFWGEKKIIIFETSSPKGNYIIEPTVSQERITGIRIMTKDGYVYQFDGSEALDTATEITSYDNYMGGWITKRGPQVMWPLVSIKTPSGKTVTLEYEKPAEFVESARPISYIIDRETNPENPDPLQRWTHFACLNEQKQRSLYLKKVTLPDVFSIDFTYSGERRRESYLNRNLVPALMTTERLLNSIEIKNLANHSTFRTVKFSYTEGYPNPVPFLYQVNISDIGFYEFSYWNVVSGSLTPYKGNFGIDHWGYSNGKGKRGPNDFFPRTSLDNNKETITSSERDPDFQHTLSGALHSIIYPTRGKTVFTYEPNDYYAAVIKSAHNSGKPYLDFCRYDQTAGGIRIKQIIDYDYEPRGNAWLDTISVRTFRYVDHTGRSTGILLRSPRYCTSEIPYTTTPNPSSLSRKYIAASDLLDCIETDHPIEYKSATETYRDGSYCTYEYTNYTMGAFADQENFEYSGPSFGWTPDGIVINDPYPYLYMHPGSRKASRGKLTAKALYHAKEKPTDPARPSYVETNSYNMMYSGKWLIRWTRYYWYQSNIFTESPYLKENTKRNYYDDGSSIWTHTSYKYDFNTDYVLETITRDHTGKCTKQNAEYASGPYPSKIHTQIKLPGEIEYKTTEIRKYDYLEMRVTPYLTIPRLQKVWKTQLDVPKTYASDKEYEADLVLEQTLLPSPSRFNQVTDRAGKVTSYLYGGNSCNLLAVVHNVPYNDVIAALGNPNMLDNYCLTDAQEKALRDIPKAQVTTYSYIPLTGLASVTDPAGNRESYSYDSRHRLYQIYNGDYLEKTFTYQVYNLK